MTDAERALVERAVVLVMDKYADRDTFINELIGLAERVAAERADPALIAEYERAIERVTAECSVRERLAEKLGPSVCREAQRRVRERHCEGRNK